MRISDWSSDVCSSDLSRYSQNHPLIKAVLPFIRTPTNLIKFTAERSPLAPMVKEWRKDFMAGGARRDLAIEIGRASCRERVWHYVYISVVAVSLKKKRTIQDIRLKHH